MIGGIIPGGTTGATAIGCCTFAVGSHAVLLLRGTPFSPRRPADPPAPPSPPRSPVLQPVTPGVNGEQPLSPPWPPPKKMLPPVFTAPLIVGPNPFSPWNARVAHCVGGGGVTPEPDPPMPAPALV